MGYSLLSCHSKNQSTISCATLIPTLQIKIYISLRSANVCSIWDHKTSILIISWENNGWTSDYKMENCCHCIKTTLPSWCRYTCRRTMQNCCQDNEANQNYMMDQIYMQLSTSWLMSNILNLLTVTVHLILNMTDFRYSYRNPDKKHSISRYCYSAPNHNISDLDVTVHLIINIPDLDTIKMHLITNTWDTDTVTDNLIINTADQNTVTVHLINVTSWSQTTGCHMTSH